MQRNIQKHPDINMHHNILEIPQLSPQIFHLLLYRLHRRTTNSGLIQQRANNNHGEMQCKNGFAESLEYHLILELQSQVFQEIGQQETHEVNLFHLKVNDLSSHEVVKHRHQNSENNISNSLNLNL